MTFWDTRLQLHWAAQATAGVGRTVLPAQPDFSHESLTWTLDHGALLCDGVPRAGIRLRDMTLLLVEESGTVHEFSMNGRTLADGFEFFEQRLGTSMLKRPAAGMPDHPVAHGATFDADRENLERISSIYAEAYEALDEVRRSETGSGPVRCWPHHFDIATLITISGHGEEARTIGVGMTPGDEGEREPYYYVTPWPYPKDPPMPPLPAGRWHTEEWFGALLPVSDTSSVRPFLTQAIHHCRSL
jgi:hypothetical protein